MIERYHSLPHYVIHRVAGCLRRQPRPRIAIIGGADGPTAVFRARLRRPCPRRQGFDHGRLHVEPALGASLRALRTCAVLVFLLALAGSALYQILGGNPDQ